MANDDHELLIILNQKMDSVLETLKQLPKIEDRVCTLEINDSVKQEQISTVKDEVEKLRDQNSAWNLTNSIAVVIATILGISIK